MLKGENIICISSIDWDFIWQGHQEIMSVFAKNGNRVLFIENTGVRVPGIGDISRLTHRIKNWFSGVSGIRKEMDNLYVFSPLLLPFPYLRIALWINRHLMLNILEKWVKIMNFTEPIIWVFLPTPLSLNIIDNLNNKVVIYYCIDNFRVSSTAAKKIEKSEIKLLKKADLVFVTSRELYNYCSTFNNKVYFFPFAVNFQEFEKIRLAQDFCPGELRDIQRPIIGYVGGLHKWVDLNLIREAALKYPDYSFVFVGPIQTNVSALSKLKNVHFLGRKDHREVPGFIKNFDVCVVPYLVTDYTKNVYPTKLNEYLAMGKPVVSTDLPEVVEFNKENGNLILVSKSLLEFISYISMAIDNSNNFLTERYTVAKKNSWMGRIEQMSMLLQESIEAKSRLPLDWQETLVRFYKVSRKRFFKLVTFTISVYFIVYYTPLFWFLARPLQIAQPPQKADCIVVFAGGVGESGKAGQDYEERVQTAVELYKKEYARNIIFSSGYMHIFKEPLVMKGIAVSLGVPEDRIVLEDKAHNTYENVKFSKEVLERNGWNEIILVSSSYHMRRVSLVFKSLAKNIKVIYVPKGYSSFYSVPEKGRLFYRRINHHQIRSIIHEYLGILYYWWKGYI